MRKIIWTILIALLAVVAVGIVWINQTSGKNKINSADSLQTNQALKKALLERISHEEVENNSGWNLRDCQMNHVSIDEMLKGSPRLCLFVDRSQCDVCWKKAIEFIKESIQRKDLAQVCILLADFQPNDIHRIQSFATDIPIYYLADVPQELACKIEKGKTHFFVLENPRTISHLFMSEGLYESIGKEYIQDFLKISRQAKCAKQAIKALNPEIRQDSLQLRQRKTFLLKVENQGSKPVGIDKVTPSCTCIMVEDFQKDIRPHAVGEITVVLVPETKGWMMRTITVELSNGQQVEFNIEAHVV